MQHSQAYYKELLSGFIRNTITIEEVKELYLFIDLEPEMYKRLMSEPDIIELTELNAGHSPVELHSAADRRISEYLQAYAGSHITGVDDTLRTGSVVPLPGRRRRLGWIAAAAVLVAVITTALIVFSGRRAGAPPSYVASQPLPSDVKAPQTNRATITLGNGRQVALDSLGKGLLAREGNTSLVKLDDGQIAYRAATGGITRETVYNTLFNPRGSKVVNITLSDGSRVWLNAGSSLTFPVAFAGEERSVAISGEAYFEVFHDASRPFYVRKGNIGVKVLGTHFNVNAYDDEAAIKVTLLQGSVKVLTSGQSNTLPGLMLSPGQQAVVTVSGGKAGQNASPGIVSNPDLEAVMAWKDGLFNFNKVSLQDVLRQLARWYDVDVEYQGAVTSRTLGGEMQRDLNLSEVLDGLRDIGVHFRIEGKKIIVMP